MMNASLAGFHFDDIEIVATYRTTRLVDSRRFKKTEIAESLGEQTTLDLSRNLYSMAQFALTALPLRPPTQRSRHWAASAPNVSLDGPVSSRNASGPLAVQIQDSQQRSAPRDLDTNSRVRLLPEVEEP